MNFISLIIFLALLLLLLWLVISIYNRLVMLSHQVDKAFANIEVLLKQRVEELPELVLVAKKFMEHESKLLQDLTRLRGEYLKDQANESKIVHSNQVSKALKNLFALSENYPQLKSDQHFLTLQEKISQMESKIADRRELFNDSVTLYNVGIEKFPDKLLAALLSYQQKSLLIISKEEKHYGGVAF